MLTGRSRDQTELQILQLPPRVQVPAVARPLWNDSLVPRGYQALAQTLFFIDVTLHGGVSYPGDLSSVLSF